MIKLTTLVAVLLSTSILACPNLTGVYECFNEETGMSYISKVTQTGSGINTVYTSEDDEGIQVIHADGNWRTTVDEDVTVNMMAKCSGDTLKIEMTQDIPNFGTIMANINVMLDSNSNMVSESRIDMNGSTMTDTETCNRI